MSRRKAFVAAVKRSTGTSAHALAMSVGDGRCADDFEEHLMGELLEDICCSRQRKYGRRGGDTIGGLGHHDDASQPSYQSRCA